MYPIYTYLYRGLVCSWQAAQGTINHGHWVNGGKPQQCDKNSAWFCLN